MRSISPAERRRRARAGARDDLLTRPNAVHRRDALYCMARAADYRARAILLHLSDPIGSALARIRARATMRAARACDALARSYGFRLPEGMA